MSVKTYRRSFLKPEHIYATSHTGLVRESNEDSFVYCSVDGAPNSFVAVADGVGGHDNGDLASRICLRSLLIEWRNKRMWKEKSHQKVFDFLERAIKKANSIIYKLNVNFDIQHPMGTTLVAGVIMPTKIIVAHAGDSRCYKFDSGDIKQITRDHSFVEELVSKNIITREEAKDHPFSHVISRCIGTTMDMKPEINVFKRKGNERFIFCSDGLNCHIENEQLRDIIANSKTNQDSVRNLLYASLKKGGDDNITIVSVFPFVEA